MSEEKMEFDIATANYNEPDRIEGYLEEDIQLCVHENFEYYRRQFRKQPKKTFNVAAFFFSGNWMGYRQMWREMLILDLIQLLPSFIVVPLVVLSMSKGMALFSLTVFLLFFAYLIGIQILLGFYANTIYWKKIKRELNLYNRVNCIAPMHEMDKKKIFKKMRPSFGFYIMAVIFNVAIDQFAFMVLDAIMELVFLIL